MFFKRIAGANPLPLLKKSLQAKTSQLKEFIVRAKDFWDYFYLDCRIFLMQNSLGSLDAQISGILSRYKSPKRNQSRFPPILTNTYTARTCVVLVVSYCARAAVHIQPTLLRSWTGGRCLPSRRTRCTRGWNLCIEFNTIWPAWQFLS